MPRSDAELIARAQAGDRRSFDELVARSYTLVFNTAYRILGDSDQAADATQSAYLRAYRSLAKFRGSSSFSTWLYRIVTNVCLDMVRGQQRQPISFTHVTTDDPPVERDLPDERAGPEQLVLQTELQTALHMALQRLRPEHRAVVVLYDLSGMSYDQIAEILDLPLGTVKSRLNRARRALQEELSDYWEPSQ
ncbi:MAG: sigma-70 family RNA polymerase sigma factor [Armatimonadetes bacterium]|nr:sigma-70 family RNA polymerase sigma factor [Armatimonadota bacterium]